MSGGIASASRSFTWPSCVALACPSPVAITSTSVCAWNNNTGSCHGDSGADAGDTDVAPTPGATPTPEPTPTEPAEPPTSGGEPTDAYQAALQDAQQAMLDRQAALEKGDWAAYGEADERLTAAVEKLIQLGQQ